MGALCRSALRAGGRGPRHRYCCCRSGLKSLPTKIFCGVVVGGYTMRFCLAFLLSAFLFYPSASVAWAGIEVEKINLENGTMLLIVKGDFEFGGDPKLLEQMVASSGAKLITFHSNGGNIHAAMEFGRTIRRLGLDTVQIRSAQCASACALAFAGGRKRAAEAGSIGVHRSSFSDGAALDGRSAVAAIQAMTAEILTYLVEMGVDPKLLQLSLSTDSNDMRYLTSSEMAQLGVTSSNAAPSARQERTPDAEEGRRDTGSASPDTVAGNRERALQFIERYHAAWSLPTGRALAFMGSAYADSVTFYGKAMSRDDVLKDKTAFAERWPQRAYSVKHGSQYVRCLNVCSATATVEWFALSPKRGKASSGVAQFTLVWNPATGKIESENSEVIQTDRAPAQPDRIIAQWQKQNSDCRGGPGDSEETMRACERREAVGEKLEAVGWCYGREGEYGYQMNWHVCGR
jgi:hypothetical protein